MPLNAQLCKPNIDETVVKLCPSVDSSFSVGFEKKQYVSNNSLYDLSSMTDLPGASLEFLLCENLPNSSLGENFLLDSCCDVGEVARSKLSLFSLNCSETLPVDLVVMIGEME